MNTPDIFRAIIANTFHLKITSDNAVFIREEQADAKCKWVEIKLKNSICNFCFSFDVPRKSGELDPVFPYFNSSEETKGLCSKNDAIIICQKNNQVYVLLIEMKSSEKAKSEPQLKAAKILVNFIVDRLNNSKNNDKINKQKLEFRCISFYYPRNGYEGSTEKRHKVEFSQKHGLLIAKIPCHRTYYLTQFLP